MPIKNDDYGKVRLVVFRGTWQQLCKMADVETDRETVDTGSADPVDARRNVQIILPVGFTAEATFWVCATMLLGSADAMMLAAISRKSDRFTWFDGLEVA